MTMVPSIQRVKRGMEGILLRSVEGWGEGCKWHEGLRQLGKAGSGFIFGKSTSYLLGLPCLAAEPLFSLQMSIPNPRAEAPLDLEIWWAKNNQNAKYINFQVVTFAFMNHLFAMLHLSHILSHSDISEKGE